MDKSPEHEIMSLLYLQPTTRFSYREIERNTDLSIGSISKYAKLLEKEKLILIENMPNAKYVTANIDNQRFRKLKRLFNISILYESGLVDDIDRKLRPNAIVLFGSFGNGDDTERSDIDICVVGGRKNSYNSKKYEKTLKRDISIMHLRNLNRSSKEFKDELVNGFVLGGYLAI